MRPYVLFLALSLVIGFSAAASSAGDPPGSDLTVAQVTEIQRAVPLLQGWNLVGWTGDATPLSTLTPTLGPFDSLHTFGGPVRRFQSFDDDLPDFLNTLQTLPRGAGVWVFADAPFAWVQPIIAVARSVPLFAGFNLVTWTGSSAMPVGDATANLGDAFVAAL